MLYLCSINRSSQPTDFHLLGAHDPATSAGEFSRPLHLDPVEQGLVHHAQRARCCHDGLTSIEAASCLKSSVHLAFGVVFVIFVFIALIERIGNGCVFRD